MNNTVSTYKKISFKNIFFALLGSAIMAFGVYNIYYATNIPQGGIHGIGLLLENYYNIPIALSTLVINAIFYFIAWLLMGSKFIVNSSIGAVGFSFFYALFESAKPVLDFDDDHELLAAIVGALLMEVGTGIAIRYGSAPNGDHALSIAIGEKTKLKFETLSLIRDIIIILLSVPYVDDAYSIAYALLIMIATTPITGFIVRLPESNVTISRKRRRRHALLRIVIIVIVVVLIMMFFNSYMRDGYYADWVAIDQHIVEGVEERELDNNLLAFVPNEAKAGFIFYPGARVDHNAYIPLMKLLAENGIVCVIVEMPFDLAFFGSNSADDVFEHFPEVDDWYIGGHSLGGAMAANYASKNTDKLEGVVLLGAYSTKDISDLDVLSVYGDQDQIMNMTKYKNCVKNLPRRYDEYVIEGGCHAYFGMYGAQKGDGVATITNFEQIEQTAQYILKFINK